MLYDALGDVEVALPEGARRIMDRRAAEALDNARRAIAVLEVGAEDGVRTPAVRIEPEAVQVRAESLVDQLEAGGERLDVGLLPTTTTCAVWGRRSTTT